MDKYEKYMAFLESLKTESNDECISHVKDGFQAIYESYADVVEHKEDALSRFNNKAAQIAMNMGNGVQEFLKQSNKQIQRDYQFTDDASEDNVPYQSTVDTVVGGDTDFGDITNMINSINVSEINEPKSAENSLGDFSEFI
jgi:hypothetical protein